LGFEHEGTLRSAYERASDSHYLDELLTAKLLPPVADCSDASSLEPAKAATVNTAGVDLAGRDDAGEA
jgi:hypothetical protein